MTDAVTLMLHGREVGVQPRETISQVLRCGIARSWQQEHAEDARWR